MTNRPKTDPADLWPSNDLAPRRLYAAGIEEEKVVRFGLLPALSRTSDAGRQGANAELLTKELQIKCETMWRMSALTFATVQRIAQDQTEIVAAMLAALTQSPVYPPYAAPIVTNGMIRGFVETVAVARESYRELVDIQTGRLLNWVSTLYTHNSGWNGQTDADRNNED